MSDRPAGAFQLVRDASAFAKVVARLRASRRFAMDVEADGFHRYPERVALIQLAVDDGTIWLVDPLAVPDIAELGALLADENVQVVAHAAGYDVRSLHRDFRFALSELLDTAIAAQFCGARFTGLAHVLEDVLGVQLTKTKRLQRTDWSYRPLSDEALCYAADDVRHLLPLADRLTDNLERLGRREWVVEECVRLERERFRAPDAPESACLHATGARRLSDRGRAVLCELLAFREREALRLGRPPYRIVSESALVELAERPEASLDELRGVDPRWLVRSRSALAAAVARGMNAPGVPLEGTRRQVWPRHAQTRLKHLKAWRTEEAEGLGLDPGIVWPAEHLRQVALHPEVGTRDLERGAGLPCVRRWQWRHLGASLETFRRELLDDRPAADRTVPPGTASLGGRST